jgi:hypothetical protein
MIYGGLSVRVERAEAELSWDVLIMRFPENIATVEEIPDDFRPEPLGSGPVVREQLLRSLPAMDLSDPSWGRLRSHQWSMELSIGPEEPVDSIMLYVRGTGDDVLQVIDTIVESVGARALDISAGGFLAPGATRTAGWHSFQRYRDQVLRRAQLPGPAS